MPACTTENRSDAYGTLPELHQGDPRVPTGVVMGAIGPHGAGKPDLIAAQLGLVTPLTRAPRILGPSLARVRRRVGYMPQATTVDWDFPTTVADVVTMGTYAAVGPLRRPGRRERDRARDAMDQTGIADLARRQIGELSGGQRQ